MHTALCNLLRFVLLRCPVYRGGIRVVQSAFCKSLTTATNANPSPDNHPRLAKLWCGGGMKIQVHLNDYDGRCLYFWGANDRKISWLCTQLLQPGDTLLDIGANYGSVGLLAAQRVGPQGQVHCFEPQPRLAESIRASVSLNGITNLFVHELALSDRNAELRLTVPGGHSGRGSLCAGVCQGTSLMVPVRHAGDFLTHLRLPRIRVIKLDVESHEEAVLSGAAGFLKEVKPLAIVFESHDDGKPLLSRGPVKLLRALGYDIFQLRQRPLFRVQLRAIKAPTDVETGYDFVACDKSQAGEELSRVCSVV